MSQPPQEITVKGKAARIRGATWTHDQVKKLFDVWTQPDIYNGLLNEKKKLDIFKNMASTLSALGVDRTWRECRAKIKNLKADFRKAMEKKTPFRYYDQMKKIMNVDGSASRSTGSGSATIDTYFSPIASSSTTPHSSQHSHFYEEQQDQEATASHQMGNIPTTPERTVSAIESSSLSPSSSRSVTQSTSKLSPYRSPGQSLDRTEAANFPSSSTPLQYSGSAHEQVHPRSPYHFRYFESQDEHREDWRQEEDDDRQSLRHQDTVNDPVPDHDSSSRSSMIITHVVSNVIEPVTQIVMPSSSTTITRSVHEDAGNVQETLNIDESQHQSIPTPPPIRLEFVLEDENVILQMPQPTSNEANDSADDANDVTDATSAVSNFILPDSPPPTSTLPPSRIRRQQKMFKKPSKSQSTLSPKKSVGDPSPSSSSTPKRPKVTTQRRKLFETLNQKTVETISDLLTQTSQNLLQELQDAEQRFILWEEDKRKEERKREEAMFTKLITAMKSSVPISTHHRVEEQEVQADQELNTVASDFSSVSKRINDLVCGEVKQTEESLRQWEMKMQRQESRHTEKLFAMIINAIKTSSSTEVDG